MARIEVAQTAVIWRDFFARGRPRLPTGLWFEFDHDEYLTAIAALPDVPPIEWTDELDDGDDG